MKLIVILGIVGAILATCEGVTFTRCQLVQQLRRHGFPEAKMRDWVCLVENESSRTTNKIGPMNKDGSRDYGLFQINDRYWCSTTKTPGKDCNFTCSALLTDDISKAATCAKKIFQRHGFNAWYGWKNHCQGALPDISKC